ncbi:MAG TPA: adenosylmethionine decarboxylase [Candidatus Paceibacterota bacterium]|nr:adenosylmethionine decarboxylase [Candidatus Paceibacterota bacterium]
MYKTVGTHFLMDFWGVDAELLDDKKRILAILVTAAEKTHSQILGFKAHKFSPHGLTAVLLLAESHLSIHTYPEHNFAALDVYTCGSHTTPEKGVMYLKASLKPKTFTIQKVKRGLN